MGLVIDFVRAASGAPHGLIADLIMGFSVAVEAPTGLTKLCEFCVIHKNHANI